MKTEHNCVDCRFCGTRVDLERGTRYWCSRRRRRVTEVIHRRACGLFRPQRPHAHWGP